MSHITVRVPNASLGSLPASQELGGQQGLQWELEAQALLWIGHRVTKGLGGYCGILLEFCVSGHRCNIQHQAKPWEVSAFELFPTVSALYLICTVSTFFGPNHDQEPQPDPPQPWEEMDVDRQLLWMHLTYTVWRDLSTADMSRYLSRNVLHVGGVRDIPDFSPILKHHGWQH